MLLDRIRRDRAKTSTTSSSPSREEEDVEKPRPVRTRKRFSLVSFAELCTLLSIIFLIVVFLGSTHTGKSLTSIYFLKIDVSNVIPQSIPNASLKNSIAQTLGLRDFYQVGLFGYCEGYKNIGVTFCSKPKTLYSFDPVTILLSQLLDGATIAMPSSITDALDIAQRVTHFMFAAFFVGIILNGVLLTVGWLAPRRRRNSFYIGFIAFLPALFTTIAAAIATALYCVFRSVFEGESSFNIRASLGVEMYAFVWLAATFSLIAFIIHAASCCCCRPKA